MVRIRVAARVFPEDEYLKNIRLGKLIASPIKDEKRLVVIVREPYQWQIGTLLLEIKRAYESCYGRELPTVKYLKDADDFDISPRSYVSDVLLDEGRAQTDASDQRVTVNVVSEQGRRVREGSVAVGSQLEDPQFRLQLEQTSRPPVPTFSGLPSSLGKRPLPHADETNSFTAGAKRAKHIEIPETHNEEEEQGLVSSIEHDGPQSLIEPVRDTQYLNPEQETTEQQTLLEPKDESPELRRLLQNVPPATLDELEQLPEQPPHFVTNKRGREGSINTKGSPGFSKPHRPLPPPTQTARQYLKLVEGPITPPSENSGNPASLQRRRSEDAAKPAAQLSSASSSKFKRNDIYDYPESEIDDSQMSPRSRQGQLSYRSSNGRLSRIESLESPQNDRGEDQGLSFSQAIDTLDDESVFGDDRPLEQSFRTPEDISGKASSGSVDGTEVSIYEDHEMADIEDVEQNQDTTSQRAVSKPSASSARVNGDTHTGPTKPGATQSKHRAAEMKLHEKVPETTNEKTPIVKQVKLPSGGKEVPKASRLKRERKRKNKSDATSIDGDSRSSFNGSDSRSTYSDTIDAGQPAKKAKASRRTPSLDSPGEQLSQNLQDSTTMLTLKALNKKLTNEQGKPHTTTPGQKDKQVVADGSSKMAALKTPNGVSFKQSLSGASTAEKAKKANAAEVTSSPPLSIVVQRAEQEVGSSPVLPKPLPYWGAGTPTIAAKEKLEARSKADKLEVDQQDDSRKSPSVGIGLSAEEMKTMESRKNMTKEQYEAEKKRKQQEAKKQAKQAVVRKKSPTAKKPMMEKTHQAKEDSAKEPKPATVSTKTQFRKSLSSAEGSQASLPRSTTDSSAATSDNGEAKSPAKTSSIGKANVVRRESTGASSSQASNADSMLPPKTPVKVAAKSASVKSAATTKTPQPAQLPSAAKTPAKAPAKSPSVKTVATNKTPKPASLPKSSSQQSKADKPPNTVSKNPVPAGSSSTKPASKVAANPPAKSSQATKPYKLTLSDLHKNIRSADKAPEVNKGTLLSQIKQTQKTSSFVIDDDDEEEASDSSDSSDEEEEKPKVVAKVASKVQSIVPKKQTPVAEDDDEESSEEEKDNKKKAFNGKTVPHSTSAKVKVSGQPDPSIRDKSIDSDDESEDDEL